MFDRTLARQAKRELSAVELRAAGAKSWKRVMNDNWAAVLEAACGLPREQRRWISHELLETETAIDAYGEVDEVAAIEAYAVNRGLDWEATIRKIRRKAENGEQRGLETVFADRELFANI